ncbi:MAG: myo-inositol-1-phosphate synthase [Planctomycetes bacterium]|nr:myo-inositol-1-phosphate synthase [Planctomycetota bacterium]
MSALRFGIWFIGARGGVATSTIVGLSALRQQIADETGLVSALSCFSHLPLARWDQFVVGGHEIRDTTLRVEAERLYRESRVFDAEIMASCGEELDQIDSNIRPGILWNVGQTIRNLAPEDADDQLSPREGIARITADLEAFRKQYELDHVVVINLASTEPPVDASTWPTSWAETEQLLDQRECPLPASSLYAISALELGMTYINFTPSLGATPAGIDELARLRGTRHAGKDAKTGETLMKSVLAPMFASRNLEVMSWVGHNIFGNLDGKVLDDPSNKASKVKSKDHLLEEMLGYAPQTLVSIEHIHSLADWKTAWDHIHFRGFLNTPMMLQFTWQGCDSLLAAPLVLDLARFALVARERGETGALTFLGSFFKSPIGADSQAFADQTRLLEAWAAPTE